MPLFRVPVTLTYSDAGGPGVNVWSVRTVSETDAGSAVDLQNACNAIRAFYNELTQFGTSPASIYATGTLINLGEVVNRESQEQASPTFSQLTAPDMGGDAPPALQVVVSWRTTLRARRGMGRTFLGPLCNACVDVDGSPKASVVTHIRTAAENLIEESDSATGWAVGVYGQETKLPKDATPEDRRLAPHVHRDFTAANVKDKFSVLRSRRD